MVMEHEASTFEFHPAHNHWHIGDVALFEMRVALDDNSPTHERVYFECNGSCQGIQPGWVDQYHQATDGQEIDVTGAPPGAYYQVSTTNHAGSFLVTNYDNNTAWVSFRLTRDSQGNAKIAPIANSPCSSPGMCGEQSVNR